MFRKLMKSDALRKRTSWVLALVLIPPFIFFFHTIVSRPPESGPGGTAGTIFGKPVPWELYQEQYDWVRRQWLNQLSEGSDKPVTEVPEALEPVLVQSAWNRLLLLAEAQRTHRRVSDREVADLIRSDAAFQAEGRFVPERYQLYLRSTGVTPRVFEDALRHQRLIEQVVKDAQAGVIVSDAEVRAAFVSANERLRASLVLLDPSAFQDSARAAVTDEALRADYDARPDALRTPERVTCEYVGLTRDELLNTLTATEEDIAAYYETHPDEFTAQGGATRPLEEVRETIRGVLLSRGVRSRLNELAIRLEDALAASQRFEEVAVTTGLAPRTVGPLDIGNPWVKDAPEPALLQAAFALAEGAMSPVVETDTGVYVARVIQREPSRLPPFDEARPKVLERLLRERAREAARTTAHEQRTKLAEALGAGTALEAAAQSLGLALIHPAPFTRTEPIESLGDVHMVNNAAFATPIGAAGDVVEIPQGFAFVVPQELLAPDDTTLPEQQQSLQDQLRTEREHQRFSEWMEELRGRAKLRSHLEQGASLQPFIQPETAKANATPGQPAR